MPPYKTIVGVLLLLLLYAGVKVIGSEHVRPTQPDPTQLNTVIFSAENISSRRLNAVATNPLSVQKLSARRMPSQLIQVTSVLANHSDKHLNLEVRTVFLDRNKARLNDISAWQPMSISPQSQVQYTEESTSKKASHFIVEIKHSK